MSSRFITLLLLLSSLATFLNATILREIPKHRTLVVLDSWATLETHSVFFNTLRNDGGHTLTFEMAGTNFQIKYYEEYFYDNIILMAPSIKDLKSPISSRDLIAFVESDHNLMVFGDIDSRKTLRNLFNEFGTDLEDIGFILQDRENKSSLDTGEGIIYSSNFFEPFKSTSKGLFSGADHDAQPIAFSGVGHINDPNNLFVFPILRAPITTASYSKERSETSTVSGEALTLVSGYQTRANQRVSLSGSINLCSDKYMIMTVGEEGTIQSSSNFQFCKELAEWTFKQKGVIKVSNMRHNKKGERWEGVNPENYRIKDDLEFYVDIHEFDQQSNEWRPYIAKDVQLKFEMLDPYYIVFLEQVEKKSATYSVKYRAPDKLGVYKFIIEYWRYGFTFIEEKMEVSLIQFRHDEFPRFLQIAYPYYVTVFATMGATFIFLAFFLYSDYGQKKKN